jgi:hypothetical protein
MAVEIPLKRKYRIGGKSRYSAGKGGNSQQAKPHRELTTADRALHAVQPLRVMWLQPNGKIRMITIR